MFILIQLIIVKKSLLYLILYSKILFKLLLFLIQRHFFARHKQNLYFHNWSKIIISFFYNYLIFSVLFKMFDLDKDSLLSTSEVEEMVINFLLVRQIVTRGYRGCDDNVSFDDKEICDVIKRVKSFASNKVTFFSLLTLYFKNLPV